MNGNKIWISNPSRAAEDSAPVKNIHPVYCSVLYRTRKSERSYAAVNEVAIDERANRYRLDGNDRRPWNYTVLRNWARAACVHVREEPICSARQHPFTRFRILLMFLVDLGFSINIIILSSRPPPPSVRFKLYRPRGCCVIIILLYIYLCIGF